MTKAKEKEAVVFVSKDRNLRLVKTAKRTKIDPQTGELHTTEGETIDFGLDGPGPAGTYPVDPGDSETLEFLRDHDEFESGGVASFVEKGDEPDRPSDPSEKLERVIELTVDKDADGLEELYLSERAGDSDPSVLKAAAKAIEALDGDLPPAPQAPVHQLERSRDPSIEHNPEWVADYPGEPEPAEEDDGDGEKADAKKADTAKGASKK